MDPDKTLEDLLDLFQHAHPTTEDVCEAVDHLEKWHAGRGFLPRWPVHLDSGASFARVVVGQPSVHKWAAGAELQFRAEVIALLTRVQVAIECEHRSVYVAALRALGSWARRALDSESPPGFWHNKPADWRCPTCKTTEATVDGSLVTCAHGHESH